MLPPEHEGSPQSAGNGLPGFGAGTAAALAFFAVLARDLLLGWAAKRGGGVPDPINLVAALLLPTLLATWLGLVAFRSELPAGRALSLHRPSWTFALLAVAVGVGMGPLIEELIRLGLRWTPLDAHAAEALQRAIVPAPSLFALATQLGLGLLIVPVVDELFFRGLLLSGLGERFGGRLAVPIAALLYALSHPPRLRPAALLEGLVLGALARSAETSVVAMLASVVASLTMAAAQAANVWEGQVGGAVVAVTLLPARVIAAAAALVTVALLLGWAARKNE